MTTGAPGFRENRREIPDPGYSSEREARLKEITSNIFNKTIAVDVGLVQLEKLILEVYEAVNENPDSMKLGDDLVEASLFAQSLLSAYFEIHRHRNRFQ